MKRPPYTTEPLVGNEKKAGIKELLLGHLAGDAYYEAHRDDNGVYILWMEFSRFGLLSAYPCVLAERDETPMVFRSYDPAALREKVTVCLQKSELFSTTIRDNIAIGKPGASEEEIEAAAKAAQADAFILQQPAGYDTPVAERGMSLSGGQRQRIAIARALLKRSEILIFDDSTSALDLKTEAKLYEALNRDYTDVTKIIIAQRIASVQNADRIVVLDNGTVAACGSHKELMETSPLYRDIYDSQLREEAAV